VSGSLTAAKNLMCHQGVFLLRFSALLIDTKIGGIISGNVKIVLCS